MTKYAPSASPLLLVISYSLCPKLTRLVAYPLFIRLAVDNKEEEKERTRAWDGRAARLLHHTVDYAPFIKSQLASRNQLEGLVWCTFGHVTLERTSQ